MQVHMVHSVLQVSDLLADTKHSLWQAALSKILSAFNWDNGRDAEETLCAVLTLPRHIHELSSPR